MRRSVLALVILTAVITYSNSGDWYQHFAAGEWYFAHGQPDRAEAELKAALHIANGFAPGDPRLEETLHDLGRLYEHQGRLDQAQPMYDLLVAAVEVRAGKDSPDLLDPLAALGRVALAAGDPPTAEASFSRYARLAGAKTTADPDQHRLVLATLARMAVLAGREEEALSYQRQAAALLDAGTPDNAERMSTLETLAKLELRHGSAEAGERLMVKAAGLAHGTGDEKDPATVLARGAEVALAAGHPDAAERLARRALQSRPSATAELAVRATLADAAWLQVPRTDAALADLLGAAGGSRAVAAAQRSLQELAALQEQRLPAGDPARARTQDRLSRCAVLAGDTDGALASLARLIDDRRAAGDTAGELEALEDRTSLLAAAGRTAGTVEANRELLSRLEAAHGPTDQSLIPVLERQYELLRSLHRSKEARAIKKRLHRLERALKHR
jgi:tetratricopeptide (TPR) repeat protein